MTHPVTIPAAGDSINSANVAQWHKQEGDFVSKGETLVTLETDKVSNELEAEQSGTLKILVNEGEEVAIGTLIAEIEEGVQNSSVPPSVIPSTHSNPPLESAVVPANEALNSVSQGEKQDIVVPAAGDSINSASIGQWHKTAGEIVSKGETLVTLETDKVSNELEAEASGVLEITSEEGEEVAIGAVIGHIVSQQGQKGALQSQPSNQSAASTLTQPSTRPAASTLQSSDSKSIPSAPSVPSSAGGQAKGASSQGLEAEEKAGRIERKKMTMLRRKIATHLVNAQQEAAILTTFNEVDMTAIMALRKSFQKDFIEKHGIKLGFMSFFIKAIVQGLKEVPQINGRIEGDYIIKNNFYDIGCAIGTEKGLIVPVLRDCDQMSFAEVEQQIITYAEKARDGKIQIEDLQGGCFTVSNGGVYGSLLSTPILNPPQSGILGMHTIQQRPIALNGKVEIRPMMYLALSYDHRLVDGKEAVTFLIKIKEALENPTALMLEL